jgi:S-adenosyl-L-methionine hydrolase (adenosine-forming)
MSVVTLTTDFGLQDWFVGTMKGVILSTHREAQIIDITHEVPPGNIQTGAFALAASYRFFPKRSIHVAVVDPGVGTDRPAIAVATQNYFFLAPDNGVLSFALAHESIRSIHRLENRKYLGAVMSCTFHGRDVFAPVAAHLAEGTAIQKFGEPLLDYVRLPKQTPRITREYIEGQVVYVDRFGNAITNISERQVEDFGAKFTGLAIGRRKPLIELGHCYQDVPHGRPLGLVGSTGFLEIAVNGSSAARLFKLRIGSRVRLRKKNPRE